MNAKFAWMRLYGFVTVALIVLFAIPKGDTSGYILWVLATYGGVAIWAQNNRMTMVDSTPSRQPSRKTVVHVRYDLPSGD